MRARAFLPFLLLFLTAPLSAGTTIPIGGQVSGPGGAVLKDARALLVRVPSESEAGSLELEGKTGPEPVASVPVAADGTFRLEAPETGMWKVVVQAPGHVPQEHPLLPLVEEIDLPAVRLEKDVKLEVRVTGPDGRPVPGARVRIGDAASPLGFGFLTRGPWRVPVRSGLTDAQGSVVVARGAAESLLVRAGAPELPFVERKDVRASSVALKLSAGRSRDVRIVDAAGKPVAGALVRVGESRWAAGRTSQDGLLSVPLAAGPQTRISAAAGDGRTVSAYVGPAQEKETGPRELRLPAVQELAGRVVSTLDGRPVAGALVWAEDQGAFRRTGADGAYKLAAVPGRELPVQAAAPGFFLADSLWPVAPGERRAPTLALEPAFAAVGVVVDEQGRPVAGVEIRASFQPGSRIRTAGAFRSGGTARSSAAGRFRVGPLMAGLGHQLRLTRAGYAPATADLPPVEPGRPAGELRLVLRKGRKGVGRVVDGADQPVPGAQVVLQEALAGDFRMRMMRRRGPDEGRFEAIADASGRFELPDLPAGTFDLTARGAGYAPITVPGLTVPEGGGATDLGTIVLAPGVAVEGYVIDPAGRPVEGAQVTVSETADDPMAALSRREAPPDTVTGQDGFFRVEDRRAGETVDLGVRRSGYAPGGAAAVQVPAAQPVRIVIAPTAAVEGRTVDPDGKPVAGARLMASPTEPAAMGGGLFVFTATGIRQATSGDDGAFRIEDVPPGSFELKAVAAGHQPGQISNLEVRSGQELKGVEVVLPVGAVLQGRILSPGGRPVAGAQITPVEPETSGMRFSINLADAASDGDGYYRLDGIAPGARTFQAEHKSYRKAVRELEVRPGENSLDFALEGGVEVAGRVVDDAGAPVASARVVLREGWRSWDLPSAVSGPDGSFTLSGVSEGTYRIAAEKEGYARSEDGQELTVAGGSVSGVEIKLSAGGAIVGQLSGLDFTELAQVRVRADGAFQIGRVSPDGSYRIDHVAPGERRVVASVRGARQTEGRVTLEPGVPEVRLDLEFGDGLTLTGSVVRNGEPAQGLAVTLSGPGVAGRWTDTDHDGRFRFEGLDAGTYKLTVMGRLGQGQHEESVELSRDRDLRIELTTVAITGRVVDSSDRSPVSGATVTLLQPEGQDSRSFFPLEASTDTRGQFRLPDVPEGSWRVRALLSGYAPGEVSVQVDAGSPVDELEIPLQATEGVTLEVVLPSGRPPDTVRTAVLDPAGRVVSTGSYPTGENGRVRLSSMAPGTWDLVLDADGSAPVTLPVTAPGNAGRIVLPLPGGLDLKVAGLMGARVGAKVRLTDANGKPFRSVWGDAQLAFDLDAGARKFERLPPGLWKLDVTADDGRTWTGTATVVPGGTAQVTLE